MQIRIVAFFNGGIKRVAIYMRDAQLEKFVMGNEAGRFAGSAALPVRRSLGARAAIAAQCMSAATLGGFSIPLG